MSLSGNLDIFPLEEVLRLLSRSHQSGCLRVEGRAAGRVYLEGGSVAYAAVEPEDSLTSTLVTSGLATDEGLRRVAGSGGTLVEALAPDASASALAEAIREQCVESLYRIRRPGSGPFAFTVGTRPRYNTGQSFDIELLISEADRRAAEWADIEEVVPDLSSPWHMAPELDDESIQLNAAAWRFLAALDGRASVEAMAEKVGLTAFQAARKMAELARARLVVAADPTPTEAPEQEDAAVVADVSVADVPVDNVPAGDAPVAAPAVEQPGETPAELEDAEALPVAAVEEEIPLHQRSWWEAENEKEAENETPGEPAGDAPAESHESFLEDVFGSLEGEEKADEDESGDDDDAGGFGLLRRRGLGAAFRELADS